MTLPGSPAGIPPGMRQGVPGIYTGYPHVSDSTPYPHLDIVFYQGKRSGQLPLPFGKVHEPADACQPDHDMF